MNAALGVQFQLVPRADLTVQQRESMFQLLAHHFEGVTREQFAHDLAEKNLALLKKSFPIKVIKADLSSSSEIKKVIADADLAYLGTDDYERISNNLFEELKSYFHIKSRQEWDEMQVSFFNQHHYFTNFGIKHREPQKQQHLAEIKARL